MFPPSHKQPQDEEATLLSFDNVDGSIELFHDESPSRTTSEADASGPDAPLHSQRQSAEFDHLLERPGHPTLEERLAARVPPKVKKAWRKTVTWVGGPRPPRIYKITPFFPKVQHAPIAILDRFAPKKWHRSFLLILLYVCWVVGFGLVLGKSSAAVQIAGYGSPVRLTCTAQYWNQRKGYGLIADQRRPFFNATFAFRCPADCHMVEMLNPHAVGDQEVVYKPLVVGGPMKHQTGFEDELVDNAIYRGDSFICASAVHAGFIKNVHGGCGVLKLTGEQVDFPPSKHNGITSTGFDSYFPHTFGFLSGTPVSCKDLRWLALVPSVFFTALLGIFTTSPAVFFWSTFVALFFHVGLASDPPSPTSFPLLISIVTGRFLPAAFCMAITYLFTVKRSLHGLTAQVEKVVYWLGPAWIGALNNYTFDRMIPISRLTPHDIKAQPGAVPALIIIVLLIFCIALGQAWAFRVEGRMPRYLALYVTMSVSLLLLLAVPGENVRIHHYILALLLLPGTSFQTRPSLVYQGLLVGLFINGIARWGFASILATPSELLRDAQQGTLLPAVSVLAATAQNITFDLGALPRVDNKHGITYDGISVLVNDFDAFRGYSDDRNRGDDLSVDGSGNFTWTWERHYANVSGKEQTLPEYFRFGYMAGSQVGDFSKAGKWKEDGDWIPMKKGPSR